MLIQNDTILVIFLYLQAKLQLFKIISAVALRKQLRKNFWQLFDLKKACFFAFAILRCCKARKKPSLKQTDQQELKSVLNMPAKIDIDALKSFTKSRTNETEYRQKIKNSQSRLKIYQF